MPKTQKKTGIIGDLHLKQNLGYHELIEDGRKQEKKEILDFIVESLSDCRRIIVLGDMLNSKHNASSVIKEAISFLERFGDKELFILLGNHEIIHSSESSAISFLKEIKGKNWHIIEQVEKIGEDVFVPYLNKISLEVESNKEGAKKAMEIMPDGRFLYCHQTISDLKINNIDISLFDEVIFSKSELDKKYEKVFCGHLHQPSIS